MEAFMAEPLVAELKAELAHIDNEISALVTRREAVAQLLRMYLDPTPDLGRNGERLTTVSMAEKALAEYGQPIGATELAKVIREKFGVKAAPSLQQILYN